MVTSGLLALQMQAVCALVKESLHLKSHSRFGFQANVGFALVECDGVRQDDGLTHPPLSSAPFVPPLGLSDTIRALVPLWLKIISGIRRL